MAASSLILRTLRLVKFTQARTSSSSLSLSAQSHTSARFVELRSRSFTSKAQVLSSLHSASVPVCTSIKKKAKVVSSWTEAGDAFFSKSDVSLAEKSVRKPQEAAEGKSANCLKQDDRDEGKIDRKVSFADRRANVAARNVQRGDKVYRNADYSGMSDRKINSKEKGDRRSGTRSVLERGFKPSPYGVKPGGATRLAGADGQRSRRRDYGDDSGKGSSRAKFSRDSSVPKDAGVERPRIRNYRGVPAVEKDEDDEEFGFSKVRYFGRTEPPYKASHIPKIRGEIIYGVGPVHAALQVSRREFFCLYVQENMPTDGGNASKKKDKKFLEWVLRSVIDRGILVKEISKHDLNMLVDNRPHQGLVLDASPLELVQVSELDCPLEENGKFPVWVALDEVTDPQNFGAILRSAYFLGASGVIVCAKNSAPLSAVVSKASAGALEVMEILSCRNMVKFLDKSIDNGWRVVGAAAVGRGVVTVRDVPRGVPTILVLGGEGKGLRTNVKRACDLLVSIPGVALKVQSNGPEGSVVNGVVEKSALGEGTMDRIEDDEDEEEGFSQMEKGEGEDFVAVESLNVSVAAGILLHELVNDQATINCVIPSSTTGL